MEVYLVGGAVRDKQLGRPVLERDYVVVGATAEQMLAQGFKQVGKDFPVFLHPLTQEEYALARTERKIGSGYTGFSCYAAVDVSLEDDLRRRDLTINALAETSTGVIIDPYGGQEDLSKKILRHISPAFREDPVRILRVARFMARFANLGFTIADETMRLMQAMVRCGEVHSLVPERIWHEFALALAEPRPTAFIWTLRYCGALSVILPELDALFGIPNPVQWHPEVDTGVHALMVLEQATQQTPDPMTRFAALVHDLGKAHTPEIEWPQHPGHAEAGVVIIQDLAMRLRLPAQYRNLAVLSARYHSYSHRVFSLNAQALITLLEQVDAFRRPRRWKQFLDVCEADFRGRIGFETKPYPQRERLELAFNAAQKVTAGPLRQRGLTGSLLGEQLRQQRILALEKI